MSKHTPTPSIRAVATMVLFSVTLCACAGPSALVEFPSWSLTDTDASKDKAASVYGSDGTQTGSIFNQSEGRLR